MQQFEQVNWFVFMILWKILCSISFLDHQMGANSILQQTVEELQLLTFCLQLQFSIWQTRSKILLLLHYC